MSHPHSPAAVRHGRCLCGAIRYRFSGEPLAYYACHCTDCQRRTGSAFALSLIVRRADVELLQGTPAPYAARLADGRQKRGQLCAACGTRLWGEPRSPEALVLQAGTLDGPTDLTPVAHLWTRSAQPWVVLPPNAVHYPTQPEDLTELGRLWRGTHPPTAPP